MPNLISVKQSSTQIRMVSKQQHVLQHVNLANSSDGLDDR